MWNFSNKWRQLRGTMPWHPSPTTDLAAKRLFAKFDAVFMLNNYDWHAEAGSNRHHYATRLARYLPVFVVQPDLSEPSHRCEPTGIANITILHVGKDLGIAGALRLSSTIAELGFVNPFIWAFKPPYVDFIELRDELYSLYHATENYIARPDGVVGTRVEEHAFTKPLKGMLRVIDVVVACAEGVAVDHRILGPYEGPLLTIPNGCDFRLWNGIGRIAKRPKRGARPVAFFQGGINRRVDFELLEGAIDLLPDWDWWFAGEVIPDLPEWDRLASRDNVKYLGTLKLEEIPVYAKQATVGIIAYKKIPILVKSYPAKAFEYVACGLPVVSSPVDALRDYPQLFRIAHDAAEFARLVREAGAERYSPDAIQMRLRAAAENSYDERFAKLVVELAPLIAQWVPSRRETNFIRASCGDATSVAVLADGKLPPVLSQLLGDDPRITLDPAPDVDGEFDIVIACSPASVETFGALAARARCVWFEEPPVDPEGNHGAEQLLRAVDLLTMADVVVWTDEVARIVARRLWVPKKPLINLNTPSTNPQGALAALPAAMRAKPERLPRLCDIWAIQNALLKRPA